MNRRVRFIKVPTYFFVAIAIGSAAPSAAYASSFLRRCAQYFAPEHVSVKRARAYDQQPRRRSDEDLVALRFLSTADRFRWDWSVRNGSAVRVTFAANGQEFNDLLLALSTFVALAYDGRVAVGYESIRPGTNPKPEPHLFVALETGFGSSWKDATSSFTPRERATIDHATLERTNSPVGEPTVHVYATFAQVIEHADRLAYLMVNTSFRTFELRATPTDIAGLRRRVRALFAEYR